MLHINEVNHHHDIFVASVT